MKSKIKNMLLVAVCLVMVGCSSDAKDNKKEDVKEKTETKKMKRKTD